MKRIIASFLLPVLLLSLCACGSGGSKPLKADDVNGELLCDTWRMDFNIGTDAEEKTYFLKYELDVTLNELTQDMYGMGFETVNAAYADGTTDNMIIHAMPDEFVDSGDGEIADISGSTVGLVEGGRLTFQIPGFDGAMMHMDFVRSDDSVHGVAFEKDVYSGFYFSLVMHKDQ